MSNTPLPAAQRYRALMVTASDSLHSKPHGVRALVAWRRLRTVAITCAVLAALFSFGWKAPLYQLWLQTFGVGLGLMLVFGLFEQWPRRLPRWLARWVLQVLSVGVAAPMLVFTAYTLRMQAGAGPFWNDPGRLEGFATFSFIAVLLAP